MSAPLKTFIIYARDDEAYKHQLLLHLRPLVVSKLLTVWHDGNILPGEDWEKTIKKELKASELVILLVSVHSLNSDFIQTEELRTALDGFDAGLTRVVPVVVTPCVWKFDPVIRRLQALPLSGPDGVLPVSEWRNSNLAWANVVEEIGDMVVELNEKRTEQERIEKEKLQQQKEAAEQARIAAQQAAAEEQRLEQQQLQQRKDAEERARLDSEKATVEMARKAAAERQIAEKRAVQEQEAAEKIRKKETERLRREEMEASNPSATAGSNLTKFVLIGIAVGVALLAVWLVTHNTPEDFKAEKLEQMRIDSIAMEESWKSTFVEGKLPGFRKFLDQYPNSKYAGDARKTITYLENELKKILQSTDGFIEAKMKKEASDKLQKAAEISPGDNAIVKRLEAIKGME